MTCERQTYKCEVFVDYFEVMRVWYWSIRTVGAPPRTAHRVTHTVESMEVVDTEHLLAVVSETVETHHMSLRTSESKYHIPEEILGRN